MLYNYGWRAEARKSLPDGPHGEKEPALDEPLAVALESFEGDGLAKLVRRVKPSRLASADDYPQHVPVARLRLERRTV